METTLHRQLKQRYAGSSGQQEVQLQGYRIDACRDEELIEVQLGSLSAIRQKVQRLLEQHPVRVVKPLLAGKWLIKQSGGRRATSQRRKSPKAETWLDLVHELVYFVRVFPHPRLTLEVPFIQVEEWRRADGRRRRGWGRPGYRVEDQRLLEVLHVHQLRHAADLRVWVPHELPDPFHTQHIAQVLDLDRWIAQRIAYCWRWAGTTHEVGRAGNTRLYRFVS